MNLLLVDTSTKVQRLILRTEAGNLFTFITAELDSHTAELLPNLENLLGQAGLVLQDLQGLAITVGPGSFTGLRIGVSALKALSYASRIPVLPLNSLSLQALPTLLERRSVLSLIDAGWGEVYAAQYSSERSLETIREQRESALLPRKTALSWLREGMVVVQTRIAQANFPELWQHAEVIFAQTPAVEIWLNWALLEIQRGKAVVGSELRPLYLKAPTAERKLQAGKASVPTKI